MTVSRRPGRNARPARTAWLPAGPLPVLIAALLLVTGGGLSANPLNMASAEAAEEFRWGVVAYHNGLFNESILSFTRALSLVPDNVESRTWLGRAFLSSGFEAAAVSEFRTALELGGSREHLENLVEIIERRQSVTRGVIRPDRYVVTAEIEGVVNGEVRFRRPTAVRPRADGSFYVTSFTQQEILLISANGALIRTLRGGLVGFNQPFDILETPHGTFVSEFGSDTVSRINDRGERISSFGQSGIGPGQLLGPQFLAVDQDGYLFVTDHGNRRVSKFSADGEFVLSFGRPRGSFAGFENPTGIVIHHGMVYVADSSHRAIFRFDRSGNYLGAIRELGLSRPESLFRYDEDHLLISDSTSVVLLHVDEEIVSHPADFGGISGMRITSIAADANGNLIAADFDRNRVYLFADLSGVYAGLHVQVNRVFSQEFPDVFVEVSVQDRFGRPIVGLDASNFLLTERNRRVPAPTMSLAGYRSSRLEASLLVDRSVAMAAHREATAEAATELFRHVTTNGRLRVVSADGTPSVTAPAGTGALATVQAARDGVYSRDWRFDAGVRLAAAELIPLQDRRAVIFVTQGDLPPDAFEEFGLVELAAFLRNNHVRFSVVTVRPGAIAEELSYLVEETGGTVSFVYGPQGVNPLVRGLRTAPSGRYLLRYTSALDTDFGRAYLPLTAEAYLIRRSGRDESGFFGPLRF